MNKELINTVIKKHGLQTSYQKLSQELNTSELTTFLGHVFASRIEAVSPASLRAAVDMDRFVMPSTLSPKIFNAFDRIAFEKLPSQFELIELSPLAPLGSVSALALVDPGLVLNTTRSQEVVSDSTNVLALIAAQRRHGIPGNERPEVRLCASHRVVRAQLPQRKDHTAHFRILTLVSAGRDTGSFSFELMQLIQHINYYIRLIRNFESAENNQIDIVLKEYNPTGVDWSNLSSQIEGPTVQFDHQRIERQNWNYYSPLQFQINIRIGENTYNIADGGMVDWTQKLLSDRKERLLISGFGTELFCKILNS